MRKFWTLLSREVRSYFYSPIAYIVMIFFLIISGIFPSLVHEPAPGAVHDSGSIL